MNRRIHVSVESIMVTLLLIMFAVAISVLIFEGSSTYRSIIDSRHEEENIRIALSYVNMRVKQNDVGGNIYVDDKLLPDSNVLVIHHYGEEEGLLSYIYYLDGYLYECYTDGPLDQELSTAIIPINNLYFDKDSDRFITVFTDYDIYDEPIAQLTALRTAQP